MKKNSSKKNIKKIDNNISKEIILSPNDEDYNLDDIDKEDIAIEMFNDYMNVEIHKVKVETIIETLEMERKRIAALIKEYKKELKVIDKELENIASFINSFDDLMEDEEETAKLDKILKFNGRKK